MLRNPGKFTAILAALAALLVPLSLAHGLGTDGTATSTDATPQFNPQNNATGSGFDNTNHGIDPKTATDTVTSASTDSTRTAGASTGITSAYQLMLDALHKTASATSTRTHTQVSASGLGDDTHSRTAEETVNNVSISQKASELDRTGTTVFYGGVERVAIGIALVSQAGQDKADGAPEEEVRSAREDGLHAIAQGNHDINTGHAAVAQANKIIESQNNLANVGVATGLSRHELAYDQAKAPESTNKALDTMEKVAGVPATSLIAAVNHNDTDQVISLAAGANAVGMSPDQMVAAVGNFTPSSAPGTTGPSMPVFTGVTGKSLALQPSISGAASDHLRKPEGERRVTASAAGEKPRRAFLGKDETLEPLNTEQFFGSIGGPAPVAGSEFGDPGDSLFHRVRGQYSKRRSDLLVKAAATAR